MQNVGPAVRKPCHAKRVFEQAKRDPKPGPPEEPRADRVEELAPAISIRSGHFAEAETRRGELDVRAGPCKRRRELVVVLRRERGRVGQEDAHSALD